uniref:PHD-type domain-containing protein n=1 Tax=Plectus sambesii TaxID=2011161 RepID=A0A914V0E7_9BILA
PGLVCCLCLNQRPTVQEDEVIQCDKCGLAVHENCYMVDLEEQEDSDDSSSATEPWFCEPCVYGLDVPPNCELCPNRFGAFKRSDIGGKWVHLLCALYTRGVTFGEVTHLTAVSWQELDYRLFGKKACSLCDDKLLARTGVCSQCEAGLCKTYFHPTCAQKYVALLSFQIKWL